MKRNFGLLVPAILWAILSLYGKIGLLSISDQKVPGYPNAEQVTYYFNVPMGMMAACILLFVLRRRIPKTILVGGMIVSLVAIPVYLFFYTGGI